MIRALIGLQLFAIVLAYVHGVSGVQTDEAKYLLSIPYPHPPVLRTILSLTMSFPFQAMLWRILFATAMVHAVWVVWDLAAVLPRGRRIALCALWLTASPLLLQVGTVMMVVPTALFGLIAFRLATERGEVSRASLPLLAWGWLLALGSAYQCVLFAPLVWAMMRRTSASRLSVFFAFSAPLLLLALYTLSNPLALASMVAVSTQDSAMHLTQRMQNVLWVWMLSGGALTIVGLWGVLVAGTRALQLTTLLVLLYTSLSGQHYYAILLLPLCVGGVYHLACHRRLWTGWMLWTHALSTIVILLVSFAGFSQTDTTATTIARLTERGISSPLLIAGPFGHDWQYWSPVPIVRFSSLLSVSTEDQSDFLVCTRVQGCEGELDLEKWQRVPEGPMEIWERVHGE